MTLDESPNVTTAPARTRGRRIVPVAAAVLAALAGWAVAGPLMGIDLDVATSGGVVQVGVVAVGLAALVAGLLGMALLAILERRSRRPVRTWTITAIIAFVVSLAGPAGAGDASSAASQSSWARPRTPHVSPGTRLSSVITRRPATSLTAVAL